MGKFKVSLKSPLKDMTTVKSNISKPKIQTSKLSGQRGTNENVRKLGKPCVNDESFLKEMSKAVKIKRKKKTSLSSPEVQLGLKIDRLLAEKTKISGTPMRGKEKSVKIRKRFPSSSMNLDLSGADTKADSRLHGGKGKFVTAPPKTIKQEDSFSSDLDYEKLIEPVKAVFDLVESSSSKDLLDNSCKPIYLQLNMVIPLIPLKKVVRFRLAHSLLTDTSDVCLIVRDLFTDPDKTAEHYKEKLKSAGISSINEVIPLKILQRDYNQYEDRRKLCDRFDYFLTDAAVAHRCIEKLGKQFFLKRKVPVPWKMDDKKKFMFLLQQALKKTTVIVKKGSTTVTLQIGHSSMEVEQVRDNIISVWDSLNLLLPGGNSNVRQGDLKLACSVAIPFYQSVKSPSEIDMFSKEMIWKKKSIDNKPISGEISTQPDANVLVYPSGKVVVEGRMQKDKSAKKSNNQKKKAERNKLNEQSKRESKVRSKVAEENSDEDIDIKDVEEQYLMEWSKSKGFKELAKEEAKKFNPNKKVVKEEKAVNNSSFEEDQENSEDEEVEDEDELKSDDALDEDDDGELDEDEDESISDFEDDESED